MNKRVSRTAVVELQPCSLALIIFFMTENLTAIPATHAAIAYQNPFADELADASNEGNFIGRVSAREREYL